MELVECRKCVGIGLCVVWGVCVCVHVNWCVSLCVSGRQSRGSRSQDEWGEKQKEGNYKRRCIYNDNENNNAFHSTLPESSLIRGKREGGADE